MKPDSGEAPQELKKPRYAALAGRLAGQIAEKISQHLGEDGGESLEKGEAREMFIKCIQQTGGVRFAFDAAVFDQWFKSADTNGVSVLSRQEAERFIKKFKSEFSKLEAKEEPGKVLLDAHDVQRNLREQKLYQDLLGVIQTRFASMDSQAPKLYKHI